MKLLELDKPKNTLSLYELPYNMNSLEPIMSKEVVEFHYSVLSKGYVDRYNKGEGDSRFNKAGALLHNLFWPQLFSPKLANKPKKGELLDLINKKYDSFTNFKEKFVDIALKFQGSGWVYLSKDGNIKTLVNQTWATDILMPIDLFEHSYEPFTLRKDYMKTIWQIIDWEVIEKRL